MGVITSNREIADSMTYIQDQYNSFMSYGGMRVEYQNYIKLRESGHLDKSNGYLLKHQMVFQSESEMKKSLD